MATPEGTPLKLDPSGFPFPQHWDPAAAAGAGDWIANEGANGAQDVHEEEGANVVLGTRSDAEAGVDLTLNYTVISLLKALVAETRRIDTVEGAEWFIGTGAPANATGGDGDLYLDDATGDVYQKAAGTWGTPDLNIIGPQGPTGEAGADGAVWRDGSGAPANTLGADGDFYLDNDTGDVYEKTAGTYAVVTNIKGPAGTGDMDKAVYDANADGRVNSADQISDGTTTITPSDVQAIKRPSRETSAATSYELVLADEGKHKEFSAAADIAVFIPQDADTNFPVGSQVWLQQTGTGQVTVFTLGDAVLEATSNQLRAQYSVARLYKKAVNLWTLEGDLAATSAAQTTLSWDGAEPTVVEGDQPTLAWKGTWTGHTPLSRSRLLFTTGTPATGWAAGDTPWSAQALEPFELAGQVVELQAEYEDASGNTIVTEEIISFTVQEIPSELLADVVTLQHPSAAATQQFTSTKFTASNPVKAAIFSMAGSSVLNGDEADARHSIGIMAGAVQRSAAFTSATGQASSLPRSAGENDLAILTATDANTIVRLGTGTVLTDGVEVDWTNVATPQYHGSALLLGGEKILDAAVTSWLQAHNGTTDVDFGFTPNVVICISPNGAFDGTFNTNPRYMLGFATWDGTTLAQAAFSLAQQGAQDPSLTRSAIFSDRIVDRLRANSNASEVGVALTNINNGGLVSFTGTPGGAGNPADFPIAALALRLDPSVVAKILHADTPIATGNKAYAGTGGVPVAVVHLLSMLTGIDAVKSGAESGSFGVSFITSGAQASSSIQIKNTSAGELSLTQSLITDGPGELDDHIGGDAFRADLSNFNTDDYTLNYTAVDGTARKVLSLVLSIPS